MPLFDTPSIISTYIPAITMAGRVYLDDYLAFITEELEKRGLIFVPGSAVPAVTTRQIKTDSSMRSMFKTHFMNGTVAPIVRLKRFGSDQNDLLVENTDYVLEKLNCKSKPFHYINLMKYKLSEPHYIEVTAAFMFGFESELPRDIYAATVESFVDLYNEYIYKLKAQNRGGQVITSTKMGDVQTNFAKPNSSSKYNSFEDALSPGSRLYKVLQFYTV